MACCESGTWISLLAAAVFLLSIKWLCLDKHQLLEESVGWNLNCVEIWTIYRLDPLFRVLLSIFTTAGANMKTLGEEFVSVIVNILSEPEQQ